MEPRQCACHQLPKVFKAGYWRCPVKFYATQRRYDASAKGLERKRRYGLVSDQTRVYVGKRAIRMLTQERKEAANALIKRKLCEFKSQRRSGAG
jgi:hypothetical protein